MAARSNHRSLLAAICLLTVVTFGAQLTTASQDLLPHPCDAVKCPPLSDISCPEDSDIREIITQSFAPLQASILATPAEESSYNTTEIAEDLYAQCCLAKKCICKTCFIPDCNKEDEVVIELLPESMESPGRCCGQYECHTEPNCTEVRDTDSYWLTDCQRCKCFSGERICHQSCDEGMKKTTAICNSKNLNTFFEHGDSWKDGCYECECVNGEEKCVMPFCRSVNCPLHRQVILKDSCCPICWPKGIPMPNGDEDYDDDDDENKHKNNHNYDDDENEEPIEQRNDEYAENAIDTLPNIKFEKDTNTSSTSTSTSSSTTERATTTILASTEAPGKPAEVIIPSEGILDVSTSTVAPPPCLIDGRQDAPATYRVYPEVVEVVRQTHQNDLLYAVIGCLALVVLIMAAWNIHLRAKQRSYRPVSNFDDNFNKMSSNIKKMNDYV